MRSLWGIVDFGVAALGSGMAVQPDGKVVLSGRVPLPNSGWDFAVARLLPNLDLDTSFSDVGMATLSLNATLPEAALDVAIQQNGKILIAGYMTLEPDLKQMALVRFLSDGRLDMGFNDPPYYAYTTTGFFSGYDAQANGAAIAHSGRIVLAGWAGYEFGQPVATACYKGDEDLVFYDDFEWGSTAWWSASTE